MTQSRLVMLPGTIGPTAKACTKVLATVTGERSAGLYDSWR